MIKLSMSASFLQVVNRFSSVVSNDQDHGCLLESLFRRKGMVHEHALVKGKDMSIERFDELLERRVIEHANM